MNSAIPDTPKVERANTLWRQRFVSDLFHILSQPLTALHCSLDLSLRKRGSEDDYRRAIRQGITLTEQLITAVKQARQFAEAEDPGSPAIINLGELLRDVAADFEPVAELMRVVLYVVSEGCTQIIADPERMQRAIFSLIDQALGGAPVGSSLLVVTMQSEDTVHCYVGPSWTPLDGCGAEDACRELVVELSGRMVAAAGGRMIARTMERRLSCVLDFPIASSEGVSTKVPSDLSS